MRRRQVKPSEIFSLQVRQYAQLETWDYDFMETPFGNLIVAGESPSISYIGFYDHEKDALKLLHQRNETVALAYRKGSFAFIAPLINGKPVASKIILSVKGTKFQEKVWMQLMNIPFGGFVSYGQIAASIKQPTASRAVGTAVGKNPIAYFIPCHRVLGAGGRIGGYYWGTEVKKRIIEWEQSLLMGHS